MADTVRYHLTWYADNLRNVLRLMAVAAGVRAVADVYVDNMDRTALASSLSHSHLSLIRCGRMGAGRR